MKISDLLANKHSKGTNKYGYCTYCHQEVEWRLQRALNHSIKCPRCPKDVQITTKATLQQSKRQKTVEIKEYSSTVASLHTNSNFKENYPSKLGNDKNTNKACRIDKWVDSINDENSNTLDLLIAKFFYRTGIPFNTADCNEWKSLWRYARPSYTPPSSKKLRTTLLEKTNAIMKKQCDDVLDESNTVSLVTDGWSNIRNDHLVNYIVLIPNKKPLYYGYKDTKGVSQTSKRIAEDISEVIEEIGKNKVVALVSDNASNMRGAWSIIEKNYPHIFANGCAAHVLNLLIQDFCKLGRNEEVLEKATNIVKFIKNRTALTANFRNIQKTAGKYKRFLSLPVVTRWYTQHMCFYNLVKNEDTIH